MRRSIGDMPSRRGEAQRLLLAATLLTCVLLFAASRQLRAPAGDALRVASRAAHASHAQPHLTPAPLVAIADIHGDLENALKSLQLRRAPCKLQPALQGTVCTGSSYAPRRPTRQRSGVADDKGAWIGGTTNLVQTGDLVDRGDSSVAVLRLFWRLRDEARAAGGNVTLLLGNHEIWAMSGQNEYVSEAELRRLGQGQPGGLRSAAAALSAGRRAWDALFSATGDLGRVLAATHEAAAVVGEGACRTLFVHAGLSPAFAKQSPVAPALTARLRAALAKAHGPRLAASDGPFFGAAGPFWLRKLALGSEAAACADVAKVLRAADATRMVVGHTVQPQGARTRCGGALVLLDSGVSRAYYGSPAAWECREVGGAAALEEAGRRPLQTPQNAE